jgi:hypothetical protein
MFGRLVIDSIYIVFQRGARELRASEGRQAGGRGSGARDGRQLVNNYGQAGRQAGRQKSLNISAKRPQTTPPPLFSRSFSDRGSSRQTAI